LEVNSEGSDDIGILKSIQVKSEEAKLM